MDFKDLLKQISERAEKLRENLQTEEATKNALIMPFISALGYDVFNPLEVVPEYTCDIGTKKGEKIDYAIIKDNEPIILIECKHCEQDLTLHDNQLLRYFHVSKAKFGILTNGLKYRFYTDLDTINKMDEKPFLEIDILDIKDFHVEELKKFHKSNFSVESILSSASELKYTNELKRIINEEFNSPSSEFVKLFAKRVYSGGIITNKIMEQFTDLVKKSLSVYVNDKINERLKSALSSEPKQETQKQDEQPQETEEGDGIITTIEELQAFTIVKSILRDKVDISRIIYKDTIGYFGITLDNFKKTFCRLRLDGKNKTIAILDENKKETKYPINTIDDIYNYSEQLLKSLEPYL